MKLNKDDLVKVLRALANASVVTDTGQPSIVWSKTGPADIKVLVSKLGKLSLSKIPIKERLSTGVELISKPSSLQVPPWQMVSALLGGVSLRVATWWSRSKIWTTHATSPISCWTPTLPAKRGEVALATSGHHKGIEFSLEGGPAVDGNHSKIGVSTSPPSHLTIFGDMNQEGSVLAPCAFSQNARGGLFFVVDNDALHKSVTELVAGDTAPTKAPLTRY